MFTHRHTHKYRPSAPGGVTVNVKVTTLKFIMVTVNSCITSLPLRGRVLTMKASPIGIAPLLLVLACLVLAITRLCVSPLKVSFISGITPPGCRNVVRNK